MYSISELKFAMPDKSFTETSNARINIFGAPIKNGVEQESRSVLFSSDTHSLNLATDSNGGLFLSGYGKTEHIEPEPHEKIAPKLVEAMTTLNIPQSGYQVQLSSLAVVEMEGDKMSLVWQREPKTNQKSIKTEHYKKAFNPKENEIYNKFAMAEQEKIIDHAKKLIEFYQKKGRFN